MVLNHKLLGLFSSSVQSHQCSIEPLPRLLSLKNEDCVGRPSGGHDNGNRIFDRFLVIICREVFFSIAFNKTFDDSNALSVFSESSFAIVEEKGRLIPIASKAELIVLAVNIPPQEPVPGHALFSISLSSFAEIFPAEYSPTASKLETIVRSLFLYLPGFIVPP